MAGHGPSVSKAKKILSDESVRGKPLSMAQRRFFGARAGGAPVKPKAKKK